MALRSGGTIKSVTLPPTRVPYWFIIPSLLTKEITEKDREIKNKEDVQCGGSGVWEELADDEEDRAVIAGELEAMELRLEVENAGTKVLITNSPGYLKLFQAET